MFLSEQYSLIDFGNGRRLERIGELVLDRPCPTVDGVALRNPEAWLNADVRFEEYKSTKQASEKNVSGTRGRWIPLTALGRQYFPDESLSQNERVLANRTWKLFFGDKFVLELKGSPFGHIGVFPEQAENWDKIIELCQLGARRLHSVPRVLNLFGYTGGSALAALSVGAETTHLDAARNIVQQAKRNALLSFSRQNEMKEGAGVARWIVDDAVKFVKREIRREARYNGVILDPPTYGHGARGEVWRLSRDLEPLLERIFDLLIDDFCFVILTGHTRGFEAPVFERLLRNNVWKRWGSYTHSCFSSKQLTIKSLFGATLDCGDMALFFRDVPR